MERHKNVKQEILKQIGETIKIDVVDRSGKIIETIYGQPQNVDYMPNEGSNDPFESLNLSVNFYEAKESGELKPGGGSARARWDPNAKKFTIDDTEWNFEYPDEDDPYMSPGYDDSGREDFDDKPDYHDVRRGMSDPDSPYYDNGTGERYPYQDILDEGPPEDPEA